MEWHKLELTKASVIKKEVDQVINMLNEAVNNEAENKSSIVNAIQARIQELENFYIRNNDDERAILFEKERLRLRKAVQSVSSSSTRSVSGLSTERAADLRASHSEPKSSESIASGSRHDRSISTQNNSSQQQNSTGGARVSRITTPLGNKSVTSGASVASNKQKSPTKTIYAWEDPNAGQKHGALVVDNVMFTPTTTNGFYERQDNAKSAFSLNNEGGSTMPMSPLSEKYCDFQVILTLEELTTLASRKRSDRPDAKLQKSKAAATSVHSSTPYVDNKRIMKAMFRPENPEKWINPEGMRPYKKYYM